MTSTLFTVGISVGLLFAGLLAGYVIAEQAYSPRNMMINDPQATTPWMESMMGTMMGDSELRNEMMEMMMQNPDMMQDMAQNQQMMKNSQIMQSWMNTMMNDPELGQEIMNQMMQNPQMMQSLMENQQMMGGMMMGDEMMSNSMMSGMQFSTNAPMTMPMIDGYYNGEKVFFVHTEVSDNDMAQMMSTMINFPTIHVSDLKDVPQNEISKVYVFTNGIAGSGPYGGGPFMFQIDVFDSIPEQTGYSQFRVPYLVTWNDDSTPRILTSVDEILEAETTGELTIQKTDNVVNAPMMVWKSNGIEQRASMIQRMFESMPGVDGEVMNLDVENYLATFKLHSPNNMDMMNMMEK